MREGTSGLTILLTREGDLADDLRSLGAEVRVHPLVRYEAIEDVEVDPAAADWIVFTSPRAVAYWRFPLDAGPKTACVGPGTARAVTERGGTVDYVPERHDAASLAAGLLRDREMRGARVAFPCSDRALDTLETALAGGGARVERIETYRCRNAGPIDETWLEGVDVVVFMAPSAVEAFVAGGGDLEKVASLAIGPTTAAALRERGVEPVVAKTSDREGLIRAIEEWEAAR